ncbi:MAG: SH3 domain-containing protein [Bacteroidota bacterium]
MRACFSLPLWGCFLLTLFLVSCQPSGDQKTERRTSAPTENLLTIVPEKANLYAKPDLGSTILQSYGKGEFVIWDGKESDQKERQTVNGQELEAYWFQVRTKQGQVGWMWSGNLTNAPNAQVEANTQDLFSEFLSQLNPANLDATRSAIVHFKKLFPTNGTSASDAAFQAIQSFFIASADSMNNLLYQAPMVDQLEGFADDYELDAEAQQFRRNLVRSGFLIRVSEGMPYIEASPKYLLDNLKNYISPAMSTYQTQFTQESEQGFLEDAGLVIPLPTLANRIYWKENFLRENPDFIYRKEIEALQKEELAILLLGIDNTPAFDFETERYSADRKDLLAFLLQEHPDGRISQSIQDFLNLLEKENGQETESLQQFVQQIQ